jgi:hypothetical protein
MPLSKQEMTMLKTTREYTALTDEQLEIVSGGGFVDFINGVPWCGTHPPVSGGGGWGPGSPNVPCGTHPPHLTFSQVSHSQRSVASILVCPRGMSSQGLD